MNYSIDWDGPGERDHDPGHYESRLIEREARFWGALHEIADKEPGMCVFGDPPALSADEANKLLSDIFIIVRVALAPRE